MASWANQKETLALIIQLLAENIEHSQKGYTIESVENFRIRYSHLFGSVEKEAFYCLYKRAHCENLLRLQLLAHQEKSRKKKELSKSKRCNDRRTNQQHQELQSGKSNRKEDLSTNQQQHQELLLRARHEEPKKERIASKRSKVMMSNQLHFPNRVVQFSTDSHDRVHVHIYPPSGFNLQDINEIDVPGGTRLVLKLKWPESFLSANKIYAHPKFGTYFHRQHPKYIAFVRKTNEMVGRNDSIESELIIDLPPGNEYHPTDDDVSGHPFVNSIKISNEALQDERQRGRRAMVVWLIDLTKKSEDKSMKYSQRDVAILGDKSDDDDDLYG